MVLFLQPLDAFTTQFPRMPKGVLHLWESAFFVLQTYWDILTCLLRVNGQKTDSLSPRPQLAAGRSAPRPASAPPFPDLKLRSGWSVFSGPSGSPHLTLSGPQP